MENGSKTLRIPLLENGDIDNLELHGTRFDVCRVNWPADFPYAPLCAGRIGRTKDALLVSWRVSGLGLTIRNLRDGGTIWEDSCCEIFLKEVDSPSYINIEVNAGGHLLAARGTSRHDRVPLPLESLSRIVRFADVDGPVDQADGICSWSVTLIIPFGVIGLDPKRLPEKLQGNIYKCGDKTAFPHFLSWAPIGTPSPDFHCPEYFGEFLMG